MRAAILLLGLISLQVAIGHQFKVLTFNTWNFYAPYANERTNVLIDALNQQDLDLLCLQELWDTNLRGNVINGISSNFPYTYHAPARNSTCTPTCPISQTEPLLACFMENNCIKGPGKLGKENCAKDHCADQLNGLSADCITCLENGGGDEDIEQPSSRYNCVGLDTVNNPGGFDHPLTSCDFLYGGESDVLLASTRKFNQTDTFYYSASPFVSDTVIYGKIIVPGFGNVHAFCTHLATSSEYIDLDQENSLQTQELINYVNTKVPNPSNRDYIIVMGDFASGPSFAKNTAFRDANYNLMLQNNFTDLVVLHYNNVSQDIPCTLCTANKLNPEWESEDSEFRDHIFANQDAYLRVVNATTFATDLTFEQTTGDNDTRPISAHYGWTAIVTESPTQLGPSSPSAAGVVLPFFGLMLSLLLLVIKF